MMCIDNVYVHNEAPRGGKSRTVLMKTNCFMSLNMFLQKSPDLEDLQNILTEDLVSKGFKYDLLPAKERSHFIAERILTQENRKLKLQQP